MEIPGAGGRSGVFVSPLLLGRGDIEVPGGGGFFCCRE